MKPILAIYGIQDRGAYQYPGYTHDHSLCLMESGQVKTYLQLERHTRRKYDNTLHLHLEDIFDSRNLDLPPEFDLAVVNSFVGNSFLSKTGRIRFEKGTSQQLTPFPQPQKAYFMTSPWTGREINAYSVDHELAHIASNLPFHGPFKDNSLLIHFDGGASLGNFSAFHYAQGQLKVIECHWKLSHLSKFFNDNALTFSLLGHHPGEHCAVPGKLMGYATLGNCRPDIAKWLTDNKWFKDIWQNKNEFYHSAKTKFNWQGQLGNTHDPFLQDIAATFQYLFETEWIGHLRNLQNEVQADYLYLSGGCTLNIIANTKIVNSGMFRDVFAPPCPGDSGLSIGAASLIAWQRGEVVAQHTPFLNNFGLQQELALPTPETIAEIAQRIASGQLIGLANGYGEAGPRALGNRSIVARPDSKALARKASMECKGREWYRPIAPVMLEKHAKRLTGQKDIHHLSRYMLLDFFIPEENRREIEGVVHHNGTSRIQALFQQQDNPFLWELLHHLDTHYGIPALINTSFNRQGEPIVHTPEQALDSAQKMGLDAVVIDGKLHNLKHKQHHELEKH